MARPSVVFSNKGSRHLSKLAERVRMVVFDFDGVFTDNRVLVFQNGEEGVWCSRADGIGLEAVRNLGIALLVISKERNPIVSVRCKKLKIACIQGCDEKYDVLKVEADKRCISLTDVAYVGNDINDIECLEAVGFPVCVADAANEVKAVAIYSTKVKGGHGAVREFCDFLVKTKQDKKRD